MQANLKTHESLNSADHKSFVITDNWREPNRAHLVTGWGNTTRTCTGTTTFVESALYPQVHIDDYVDAGRMPKGAVTPKEPTPQERELHELTHIPYRSWCPICVRAKARGTYHTQHYDRKPVIQVDYSFLTGNVPGVERLPTPDGTTGVRDMEMSTMRISDKGDHYCKTIKTLAPIERETATILTAIDVTTGLTMSCVVPAKGENNYAVNELYRFILECGRSNGILQSDQENAVRVLLRTVALKLGMRTRLAPAYSSRSQGSVERWHK